MNLQEMLREVQLPFSIEKDGKGDPLVIVDGERNQIATVEKLWAEVAPGEFDTSKAGETTAAYLVYAANTLPELQARVVELENLIEFKAQRNGRLL